MPALYNFWKLSMKLGINRKIVVEHVFHLLRKDVSILQISKIKCVFITVDENFATDGDAEIALWEWKSLQQRTATETTSYFTHTS